MRVNRFAARLKHIQAFCSECQDFFSLTEAPGPRCPFGIAVPPGSGANISEIRTGSARFRLTLKVRVFLLLLLNFALVGCGIEDVVGTCCCETVSGSTNKNRKECTDGGGICTNIN